MYAIGVFVVYVLMRIGTSVADLDAGSLETFTWITAVVILTASIYGCCIAQSENAKLVFFYSGLILACIVLQIIVASVAYKQTGPIAKQIYQKTIAKNFSGVDIDTQAVFQKIQQEV